MKKRLLCLFLCFVMLLGVALTSCNNKTDEEAEEDISEEASEQAITLTMWVVSKEKVSEQTAAAVESALNVLTKAKYKTQLVLRFFTEDEYQSELEKSILAYEESLKNKKPVEDTPETEEDEESTTKYVDETETNEWGFSVIKYPSREEAIKNNQVDIIYIAGEDMYLDFIDREWLAALDTELSSASKKIKEYVSGTLLSAAKQGGTTYAIPNNRMIGEYTYMLLNKQLTDRYAQKGYVTTGKIDGFYNSYLYTFLNLVKTFEGDSVVPIDNTYYPEAGTTVDAFDYCLDLMAHYWSIDPESYTMLDDFSVFGYHYKDEDELTRGSIALGFNSLFEDAEFTEDYLKLNQMRYDGYFGDATGKTAAVKFMDGDYTVLNSYNQNGYWTDPETGVQYYPIPVKYPTASTEDIYGNMFGVCTYTKNVGRSMEIVTYLNTNSEFRNILQYGVKGTHYNIGDDGKVNRVIDKSTQKPLYEMDIYSTGNVFIAYPEPQMSDGVWEIGKLQNRYSMVDPLLGFDLTGHSLNMMPEADPITIDSKLGYTLMYSSGYSKDFLSENAALKTWLGECDKTPGIYVFKTYQLDGQDLTINYYVYNNTVTKETNFRVFADRVTETTQNDKGKDVVTQKSLDFHFIYEETGTPASENYELSLVTIYTKKTNAFEVKVSSAPELNQEGDDYIRNEDGRVKVTNTDYTAKEQASIITVDFLNTKSYQIEAYENLQKPDVIADKDKNVMGNAALTAWIKACDKNKDKKAASYVYSYTSEPDANGMVETTLLFYRTGLQSVTEMELIPAGTSNKLNLQIQYTDDVTKSLSQADGDVNYLLCQYRITAPAATEVTYTITNNGEAVALTEQNIAKYTEAAGDANPNFVMIGNLDTELVKFIYTLNAELTAKLEACTNITELTELIELIKILLSTEITPELSEFTGTALEDLVNKYTEGSSLESFHRYIQCYTDYETVLITTVDGDERVEIEYEDTVGNTQPYTYYDSPYAVYNAWMSTYGYKPAA